MNKRDDTAERMLSGRCLCGTVTYQVADAFLYALNCHCSDCQRATGSAFKPLAGIERDKLRLVTGSDRLMVRGQPVNHDARCAACGSLLYSVVADGARVHIILGTLTDTPSRTPECHIFVGSKAAWYTIADDLPQYDGHIPSPPPGSSD